MEMQSKEEPFYMNTESIQQISLSEKQKRRLPKLNTSRVAIILSIVNTIVIIGVVMWTYFWVTQQIKTCSVDVDNGAALGQTMDCQCTKGEPGLRGPQGIAGINGTDGESGPPGIDGSPGNKGSAGQRGAKGDPGLKGAAGIGVRGQRGAAGASGQKGQKGQKGVNGDRGLTGSKGSTGLKGKQGVRGESAGLTHGDVRLGGKRLTDVGKTILAGALEVFYGSSWGYVCDDGFHSDEARVVCRNLGMDYVNFTQDYRLPTSVTDFPLDDVNCNGSEERLTQCSYDTTDNCGYTEGVFVTCEL